MITDKELKELFYSWTDSKDTPVLPGNHEDFQRYTKIFVEVARNFFKKKGIALESDIYENGTK